MAFQAHRILARLGHRIALEAMTLAALQSASIANLGRASVPHPVALAERGLSYVIDETGKKGEIR
jgi:hypothetical protein